MDYDPMSREHQRLFFDLNSRGAPNLPATTGVGQGPAYGSLESAVMRERPKNIPAFGSPEAWYDVVDGQIAATTPQSRAREAEEVASLESRLKAEKEEVESTRRAREQAQKIVGGELAMDYFNKWADRDTDALNQQKSARQNYIDQIADTLDNDGSRTIVEPGREERGLGIDVERGQRPIYPEGQEDSAYRKPREGPGSAVSNAQNALVGAAGKLVSDKAKDVSNFLKKNLMTFNPYPKEERGADPDIQRGQFPIYPEGQNDSSYEEPQKPQKVNIGPAKYNSPTYVVPESEIWNNMSPEEQRAMAIASLQRNEVQKFFGGREAKKGSFLGFGGERTARFSEDNSGQTPEETARLNRQAKMLNKLLDDADSAAEADAAETAKGPKSESDQAIDSAKKLAQMYAGRLQGGDATGRRYSKAPTVDLKSEVPAGTQQYLDQFRKNIGQPVVRQEWPGGRKYSPNPFKSKNSLLYSETPNEGNEAGVTVSQGTTKQAQNLDQNTLDSMFIRLYGNEMFRALTAQQRNLMLMRGRGKR